MVARVDCLACAFLVLACSKTAQNDIVPDASGLADGSAQDSGTKDGADDGRSPSDTGTSEDGSLQDGAAARCGITPAFDVSATYTRALYVAADGNDGNDGSSGAPLLTVRAAAEHAQPGTRVVVRAGTYGTVRLPELAGTATLPIAFVADGQVTIEASSGIGWAMSDAQYVIIQGFTIENAAIHGMNLDDGGSYETPSHHVVLRNMTIRGAGSGGNNDCIKMSGVDDFWVLDSDISGCNRGEIIDMVGCHRGVIHGNTFHAPMANGVQAKGGSSDTLIHGNIFRDIPGRAVNAGGSTGLEFFRPLDAPHEAARIRVVANVFERVGADSGAPIAYVGCDACEFVNNTVVLPETWLARILQETVGARFVPSRNGVFANNLVVWNEADLRTAVNVGADTSPETFTFAHNLWYALDRDPTFQGPVIPSPIPPEVGAVTQRDPALRDRAGGDYRLTSESPAIGAGRPSDAPEPDFDGRCYADPPAIGAFAAP